MSVGAYANDIAALPSKFAKYSVKSRFALDPLSELETSLRVEGTHIHPTRTSTGTTKVEIC